MVVFITNHYYSLGERPKSHQIYPLFKRVMPIESVSNKVIHLAVHELTSLLLYHCSAESRGLRCWLKHDVIPALDGMSKASDPEEPTPCMLEWPELSISMLIGAGTAGSGCGTCRLCCRRRRIETRRIKTRG